jgi:serine/threonine protein kinase
MNKELTPGQLVEVLRVERRRRWQTGDHVLAEAYFQRYPALAADPDRALEVVYHEILLRDELNDEPRLEEYQVRFPQLAPLLDRLFQVHRYLETGPCTDPPAINRDRPETPSDGGGARDEAFPVVPGYDIQRRLGAGGMGVVYQAWDQRLQRLVALKMIRTGTLADAQEVARFRAEAQAQAQLQHPNIVQVFQVGEAEGCPYFALEYVDGGSLDQWLAGMPQPPGTAAQLVETLARAVQYAHQRGLVHRDLKPANILLAVSNQPSAVSENQGLVSERTAEYPLLKAVPKISDFGLARRLDTGVRQTQSGAVVGTPQYMAPEQVAANPVPSAKPEEGKRAKVGPAADVYALGVILYEMLTGRPPFLGETAFDTLLQVRTLDPVPPRRLQPKVPRDLETICLKCLQKEPAQRYPDGEALAEDLRRFQAGEAIVARPLGPLGRWWRQCRRQPLAAGLAAALVLAVAGGFAAVTYQWQETRRERDAALQANARAERNSQVVLDSFTWLVNNFQEQLRDLPGMQQHRQEILRIVWDGLQRVIHGYETADSADRLLGVVYWNMAEVAQARGQRTEAIHYCQQAHHIFTQIEKRSTGVQCRLDLANSYLRLGEAFLGSRNLEEARMQYVQAMQHFQELPEDSSLKTCGLAGEALTTFRLAMVSRRLRNVPAAREWIKRAMTLHRQLTADKSPNLKSVQGSVNFHRFLTALELDAGDYQAAHHHALQAVTLAEQLHKTRPQRISAKRQLAGAYAMLGLVYQQTGDVMMAYQLRQLTQDLARQLREANSRDGPTKRSGEMMGEELGD